MSAFLLYKESLRSIGITIVKKPHTGEWRVNFLNGKEATAYYSNDLEDAYKTGLMMSKEV